MSISVWKDYFNTKKRYEDILGRTSEAILNANKFTTPWQRQNIEMECLKMIKILAFETPDTTPNARLRYLSSYKDIPSLILAPVCKIRPRAS